MYKKITHSIFEEQFAHPGIVKDVPPSKLDVKSKIVDNTLINTLRRQVRDVLLQYADRMRDTMLAISNGTADEELAAQYATTEVNKLAEIFGRYYPASDSATFAREFNIMTSTAIDMARAQKNNTDMTALATQNADSITALANLTATVMNGMWYKDDMIAVFNELTSNWIGQVRARSTNNWPTDFRLASKNAEYLVAGNPMIVAYSDAFATAITMSFPQQF